MNQKQKDELKADIGDKITALQKDIASLEESTQPVAPDVALGRLTRMEAIQSKSVNEAALNDARQKLVKLESALERIDTPDFGKCVSCGKTIPAARLEYMPETTVCVGCA